MIKRRDSTNMQTCVMEYGVIIAVAAGAVAGAGWMFVALLVGFSHCIVLRAHTHSHARATMKQGGFCWSAREHSIRLSDFVCAVALSPC